MVNELSCRPRRPGRPAGSGSRRPGGSAGDRCTLVGGLTLVARTPPTGGQCRHRGPYRRRWSLGKQRWTVHELGANITFTFCTTVLSQMGFLPREIRVAFPGESQLRQSRATQPTMHAGCFECVHNTPNSDMDFRIFNVRTYLNAYDCTRGCTDTVRESALKADSGRKIFCRTGESNLSQRRAGPMLY